MKRLLLNLEHKHSKEWENECYNKWVGGKEGVPSFNEAGRREVPGSELHLRVTAGRHPLHCLHFLAFWVSAVVNQLQPRCSVPPTPQLREANFDHVLRAAELPNLVYVERVPG